MVRHDPDRDQQRERVYRAERTLRTYFIRDLWADPDRLTPEAVQRLAQRFVDKVLASPWTRRHWPNARPIRVEVYRHVNGRGCAIGSSRIRVALRIVSRHVLLHEVAHCLTARTDDPGHGWRFAAVELKLVRHWIGAEAAAELKAAFKARRVRFTKPRVAGVTPGQTSAGLDALRRINAARSAAAAAKRAAGWNGRFYEARPAAAAPAPQGAALPPRDARTGDPA